MPSAWPWTTKWTCGGNLIMSRVQGEDVIHTTVRDLLRTVRFVTAVALGALKWRGRVVRHLQM